jgi:hypothetical protein
MNAFLGSLTKTYPSLLGRSKLHTGFDDFEAGNDFRGRP